MLEPRLCCTMVGIVKLAGEFLLASWIERLDRRILLFPCARAAVSLLCPFTFKNVSRQMRRVDTGQWPQAKIVKYTLFRS